jgi:hypothetical protein
MSSDINPPSTVTLNQNDITNITFSTSKPLQDLPLEVSGKVPPQ